MAVFAEMVRFPLRVSAMIVMLQYLRTARGSKQGTYWRPGECSCGAGAASNSYFQAMCRSGSLPPCLTFLPHDLSAPHTADITAAEVQLKCRYRDWTLRG